MPFSLLAFPNEIISQITESVTPDDLVNYSLSCKLVHVFAEAALKLHRKRIQTLTYVELGGCHRHHSIYHPILLFKEIVLDWKIAYYPKYLYIRCCPMFPRNGWTEEDDTSAKDDERFIQDTLKPLQADLMEIASASEYFPSDTLQRWIACEASNYGRDLVLCILIILLPNLKKMRLTDFSWRTMLIQVLEIVAEANLSRKRSAGNPAALSKLTEVSIDGHSEEQDVSIFQHFAALPSMCCLDGLRVGSCVEAARCYAAYCNITEITLMESSLSAEDMSHLLRNIRGLKKFHYWTDEGWEDERTEAYQILNVLRDHARDTLEELTLVGFECPGSIPEAGCGSLRDFRVLKSAWVRFDVYSRYFALYKSLEVFGKIDFKSWQNDIPRLIDLLPPSMERIILRVPGFINEKRLLAGLDDMHVHREEQDAGTSILYTIGAKYSERTRRVRG